MNPEQSRSDDPEKHETDEPDENPDSGHGALGHRRLRIAETGGTSLTDLRSRHRFQTEGHGQQATQNHRQTTLFIFRKNQRPYKINPMAAAADPQPINNDSTLPPAR